jgi:hypothetical protein
MPEPALPLLHLRKSVFIIGRIRQLRQELPDVRAEGRD